MNGQAPAPPAPEDDGAPAGPDIGERALGVFGLVLAAVVGGIALDMLTGGQFGLSRVIAALTGNSNQADSDDDHG